MKRFKVGELRLDEKSLKDDLGKGNTIFVGSSCDMFANAIPEDWILETLATCVKYPKNKYLFQSKNPERMCELKYVIPKGSVLGTTIETNRDYKISVAPSVKDRAFFLGHLGTVDGFQTMVTIEPIMDFDLNELIWLMRVAHPSWVNIGADSKGHNLPEPSSEKVDTLIKELTKFTEVRVKNNLKRLKK